MCVTPDYMHVGTLHTLKVGIGGIGQERLLACTLWVYRHGSVVVHSARPRPGHTYLLPTYGKEKSDRDRIHRVINGVQVLYAEA